MTETDAGIRTVGRSTRFIERPRLRHLLEETNARRILLVAPAGYGKTTLARQWSADPSRRAVWYRVSPPSADVAVLASSLARAATRELGLECEHIHQRLRTSPSPNDEASVLGHVLAEDLGEWPAETWLVLDDYQAIAGSAPAEQFVEALLEQARLRVLITGRVRPQGDLDARRSLRRRLRTRTERSRDDARGGCGGSQEFVEQRAPSGSRGSRGRVASSHRPRIADFLLV